MEKLRGKDLEIACTVAYDQYTRCFKNSINLDSLTGEADGPATKCQHLYSTITNYCSEYLRDGKLVLTSRKDRKK